MSMEPRPVQVVWAPLPGSQALALSCPAHHILYEGSRGPGKTDAQVMMFRKYVGLGYGAHWRGIIFDREYKNLDDLIAKSLRWFPAFRDGVRFLRSKSDYKWVWPTGEELYFRQIKRKEDYWNYHGQEFTYIGWNELCKYPTSELYEALMSCNRSSFLPAEHSPDPDNPLPQIPLIVFCTANPYGPGHGWVKRTFIDPAPPGALLSTTTKIFNPQTQVEEFVTKTRCRIFGSYRENRYLSPDYIAELVKVKDPNKRKAWLEGDWNIVAGGAFDDLWDEAIHVLPRFRVPRGWRLDRTFDWGSSKPFSVGWWALADGTDAQLLDGRVFCPVKGSLIRVAEWYGCLPEEVNVGLHYSGRTIAEGITWAEQRLAQLGWIDAEVSPGPADNSIFEDSRSDDNAKHDSIAEEMLRYGIAWEHSNKSPGSRKNGLQLCRDRLENALDGEGAGLYFMNHCRSSIAQIPTLPRDPDDPDDVDTEAEDHIYDEMRYRVLKGADSAATSIPLRFAKAA
jgi:hypothetical protein